MAKTLFEKIWDSHVVRHEPGSPAIIYIDCHLVHEVTSPQAFEGLRLNGSPCAPPGIDSRDDGSQRPDLEPKLAHR